MRLGIDIGGTKANIGLLTEGGEKIAGCRLPTQAPRPCAETIADIARAAGEMLAGQGLGWADVGFVGAGVPGTVAGETVLAAPNIGWHNEPVGDFFERHTGKRLRLAQDTRAAAWGEYVRGAGRGSRVLVCVTLGTGIGCGIVIGGRIFDGGLGTAGEIGHIPCAAGNRPGEKRRCDCGRFGCTEAYASGRGIAKSYAERGGGEAVSSEIVFERAQGGDALAREVIAAAAEQAGCMLTAVVNTLSPDVLLFSGGMCGQRKLFVDPLIASIRGHAYALWAEKAHIGIASLGSDAPMIGAAMLDKATGVAEGGQP